MGNPFAKPEQEHRNTEINTMNSRSARDNCLKHSQRKLSGSVKPMQEQKPAEQFNAGNIDTSANRRYPSAGAGDQKSNKKQLNNRTTSSDSASVILDDIKRWCSNLSSVEERIKNTPFSATQRDELNDILRHANSVIERIPSIMQTKYNSSTIDSAASIRHQDTTNLETLTKTGIVSRGDTFGSHQDNESSVPVDKTRETRNVGKGKVENTVPENTKTDSHQSGELLDFLKINSYLKKLKRGEVESDAIETLKNFENILLKYVNSSDEKIANHAEQISLNVKHASIFIQNREEMFLHEKREEIQDKTKLLEHFREKGKGDCYKVGASDSEKCLLASEHPFNDENSCRDKLKEINTDSRSANEKILDKSKDGGIDDKCICTKEQCECPRNKKCQETGGISEKKESDDKISRDENKLKQIEKRRNEIKSEIDCFVGVHSDPKFKELNEYSVRLLLEMDDLIVPKGSDLHKRKRELLKEVYQYSDILEQKADFEFLARVEDNIKYIMNQFDHIKTSENELNKVAGFIKYVKYELGRKDYGNLLEERKRKYIEQIGGLEKAVNYYITHLLNTNLSLAKKSVDIVEEVTHSPEQKSSPKDTSTKATSSLNLNNGTNKNENVNNDPKKCIEQSHRTDHDSNEEKKIIEKKTPVNQPKKILTEQGNREIEDYCIAEDQNFVDPSSQLRSIEKQPDDSLSGGDVVRYEYDIPTETEFDDIEKKVFDITKKIQSVDEFDTWEECQMLKDDLLREHSRLNELNINSEICEEISNRKRLLNNEILHWLDFMERQIQALRAISFVEVELEKVSQVIEVIKEDELHKLREHLIYLCNTLQNYPSAGEMRNRRIKKCYEYIQLYSNKTDEETTV